MALSPGTRLGPYEVVSPIGAGGMGEVYKARDTRLDRTVAIKVLPASLAADPQFRERFEREARAVSQLDHPHICPLYDVGRHDGATFLVLQYLEGETLEQRLLKGALPVSEALQYAIQVADALARAHRADIVHRDLKPGNVMLTKSGARLLDFGLAKDGSAPGSPLNLRGTETAPATLTAVGTIIGTIQYMAPEQIEGGHTDARTDIWAFGCALYEMLSGTRPFDGKSPASLLANILNAPTPPLRERQQAVPASVDHLVRRCLEKDPDARWQSIADVGHELRWIATAAAASPPPRRWWSYPASYVAAVLLVAAGYTAARMLSPQAATPTSATPLKVTLVAPRDLTFTPFGSNGVPHFALSPDGLRIAFVAAPAGRTGSLWVRRLDSRVPQEIPGSAEASAPFWSSDSRSLGFFSEGRLKTIKLDGERPRPLATVIDALGGTWNGDVILIGRAVGPIMKISASGGALTAVTGLQPGEVGHRWPHFLPGGRRFIYSTARWTVALADLNSPSWTKLLEESSTAVFAEPNSILYVPRGSAKLMARQLDLSSYVFAGAAAEALDGVNYVPGSGYPPASTSATGLLAYWDGTTVNTDLQWVDREGHPLLTIPAPAEANTFAISPNGRTVALSRRGPEGSSIWLMDASGATSKLSYTSGATRPIWSRDGTTVFFTSLDDKGLVFFRRPANAGDAEQQLGTVPLVDPNPLGGNFYANDWTRDGRTALVSLTPGPTARDVFAFSAETQRLTPLFHTPNIEIQPRFSPDDRWVSYSSNEGGRWEVYVEPFPPSGARNQVSVDGGSQPVWRQDGKELLFLAPDGQLMAVSVTPGADWVRARPQPLFQTRMRPTYAPYPTRFDVTDRGRRFLIDQVRPGTGPTISLVTNWRAGADREK